MFATWRSPNGKVLLGALVVLSFLVFLVLARRLSKDRRWRRGPLVIIWCFFFGAFWQVVRDPLAHPRHAAIEGEEERVYAMRLTALNGITEKVLRADADVLAVVVGDSLRSRTGKVMITLMRRPDEALPTSGDEILLRTSLTPISRIPDPGGFDRRAWAASRGMYHECFAVPQNWTVVGHGWQWTDLFEGARQRVSRWLVESGLPLRQRAMVKALVLGLRDELDGDQRDAFVRSGTIHILAVSGTHVGFIYLMLVFMFGWWGGGRRARFWRGILVLVALWCYAGLTGAHPSVLRATIMFSLFTVAGMRSSRADPLNSLFAAAFILLLWDPHMIVEVGFQLSFLAVLGILLFHGPMERAWIPNNKWVGHIWTLTVMSIAAQLLTTPLTLYLFGAFPLWFLPANLIVVTAAGFAVYGAVGLLVVHRIPFLGPVVVFLLTLLLRVVDVVTAFFAGLPGAYPAVRIDRSDVVLLFLLVLAVAVRAMWKWRPAVNVAIMITSMLMVNWALKAHAANHRTTFTVYDDRQAMQAAFTVGRSHVVLSKDTGTDDAWMRKKVERHQRAQCTDPAVYINESDVFASLVGSSGGTVHGGAIWSSPDVRVRFLNEGSLALARPHGPDIDVLVVHDLRYLGEEDLALAANGVEQIVLAGKLGRKTRGSIRTWGENHGVAVHDIRDEGAFVLQK
ncbi:MAG: ComEC/Rec2 family competence protein [Flavobacteriales bacterium]